MVNSHNGTNISTEERLKTMEQALLRIIKQMQAIIQGINQLRTPSPEGHSETDGRLIEEAPKKKKSRTTMQAPKVQTRQRHALKVQTHRRHFTPFEVPMTQAFWQLREVNLLACEVPKEGYKPKEYDPNA